MPIDRPAYPSDVSDEEWALVAPYLALLREDSAQRDHDLREVFNGLRYIVKTGAPWRFMPHDLPPWAAVYQQTQRWLSADSFADVAGDLRAVLRMAAERKPEPSAVILDSRTLRSSPESGERAGYDGAKRKRGAKVHLAVDTPGHVVALHVTPAIPTTGPRSGRCPPRFRRRRRTASSWPLSIRAITGPSPRRLRRRTASILRWSRRPRPSAGSFSCRAGGWWSAPSPGPLAADGWSRTMSATPALWRACTWSPSSVSCSGKRESL